MTVHGPSRQLNLFDAACLIIGIVIGAGVYELAPGIASIVASPSAVLAVWIAGGAISLAGALCYVELATTYPHEGGDYVFLSRAFGWRLGFLFAWCEYWIIRPGNLGMMAFVFARFANELVRGPAAASGQNQGALFVAWAASAIAGLTLLNVVGVRTGKRTQNVLTMTKVVGLTAIVAAAAVVVCRHGGATPWVTPPAAAGAPPAPSMFSLALVFALFAYGGWNDLTYVAAEVRDPQRNLFLALLLGLASIIAIYLLINVAFLTALGFEGTRRQTVAGDLLQAAFGQWGARGICLLICISCLGAINGTLFAGSRVYYAAGTQHRLIGWFGRWSDRLDSPTIALVMQAAVALLWVVAFGDEHGFGWLLAFTSPVFWTFAICVSLSVFMLRWRDPAAVRPHRVLWYPVTPLVFCGSCVFMFYSGLTYAVSKWHERVAELGWPPEAVATVVVLAAGIALVVFVRPPHS